MLPSLPLLLLAFSSVASGYRHVDGDVLDQDGSFFVPVDDQHWEAGDSRVVDSDERRERLRSLQSATLLATSLEECQAACAADGFCCNTAINPGSNQKLSCLQACMIRVRGSSLSGCQGLCNLDGCSRVVNGWSYNLCSSCPDQVGSNICVGEGSSVGACLTGCSLGTTGIGAPPSAPPTPPSPAPPPSPPSSPSPPPPRPLWWPSLPPLPPPQLGGCASDFVAARDLFDDRAACTEMCNAAGFCCTTDGGGCAQLTCTAGCHIAWHSESEEECIAECEAGGGQCPFETHGVTFTNCAGHTSCGCPADYPQGQSAWGPSNDCGGGGCAAGCRLAARVPSVPFYGRTLSGDEQLNATLMQQARQAELSAATRRITEHVSGRDPISLDEVADAAATFVRHAVLLKQKTELTLAAFDLVDAFEASSLGPLFVPPRGPFLRDGSGDGSDMDRAMFSVQQAILDHVYNAGVLANCSADHFDGRGWQTAEWFPGAASSSLPPFDPSAVTSVPIRADFLPSWGFPVAWADADPQYDRMPRQPTGLCAPCRVEPCSACCSRRSDPAPSSRWQTWCQGSWLP